MPSRGSRRLTARLCCPQEAAAAAAAPARDTERQGAFAARAAEVEREVAGAAAMLQQLCEAEARMQVRQGQA